MPPDSGGILRGCPLLGVVIRPHVVSRAEGAPDAISGAGPETYNLKRTKVFTRSQGAAPSRKVDV